MQVAKLCTHNVVTIRRSVSIVDAARLMRDSHVGALVVVAEDERALGVVTDRDIVLGIATHGQRIVSCTVGDVLGRALVAATPDEDVEQVLYRMQRHGIRRMPVVTEHGNLVGIVTLDDVLGALAAEMSIVASLVKGQRVYEGERSA